MGYQENFLPMEQAKLGNDLYIVIIPENDLAYKILFQKEAAIGFKRKNIKSLINSIVFLSKKIERVKIRKQGLKLISNTLSWEKIAKKSIEYYKRY